MHVDRRTGNEQRAPDRTQAQPEFPHVAGRQIDAKTAGARERAGDVRDRIDGHRCGDEVAIFIARAAEKPRHDRFAKDRVGRSIVRFGQQKTHLAAHRLRARSKRAREVGKMLRCERVAGLEIRDDPSGSQPVSEIACRSGRIAFVHAHEAHAIGIRLRAQERSEIGTVFADDDRFPRRRVLLRRKRFETGQDLRHGADPHDDRNQRPSVEMVTR